MNYAVDNTTMMGPPEHWTRPLLWHSSLTGVQCRQMLRTRDGQYYPDDRDRGIALYGQFDKDS